MNKHGSMKKLLGFGLLLSLLSSMALAASVDVTVINEKGFEKARVEFISFNGVEQFVDVEKGKREKVVVPCKDIDRMAAVSINFVTGKTVDSQAISFDAKEVPAMFVILDQEGKISYP